MKIALINKFYPPVIGGIEYHVRVLAENLAKCKGIEKVEILVANNINEEAIEEIGGKIRITRVANWKTVASTPIATALIRKMKELDVDLFHFHFPYPFGDFAWLMADIKKPFIITYHSDIIRQKYLNRLYAPIRNSFFSRSHNIVATSPRLIESSPVLQKFKDKTIVVPLGIDPGRFLDSGGIVRGQELRQQYDNKPIVLFVGRFVYYKGVEVLIKSFKDIDATLLMVGNGILKDKLKSMVKDYKIDNKVFFYDSVGDDELVAYFHACDIFVLPSIANTEAYGLVQLEAQACGKPVISTNLATGVPFVNKDNETGLIVEPNDIEGMNKAIHTLVNDKELRIKLGEQAKNRMLAEFTDVRMTKKIYNIYCDILGVEDRNG